MVFSSGFVDGMPCVLGALEGSLKDAAEREASGSSCIGGDAFFSTEKRYLAASKKEL